MWDQINFVWDSLRDVKNAYHAEVLGICLTGLVSIVGFVWFWLRGLRNYDICKLSINDLCLSAEEKYAGLAKKYGGSIDSLEMYVLSRIMKIIRENDMPLLFGWVSKHVFSAFNGRIYNHRNSSGCVNDVSPGMFGVTSVHSSYSGITFSRKEFDAIYPSWFWAIPIISYMVYFLRYFVWFDIVTVIRKLGGV